MLCPWCLVRYNSLWNGGCGGDEGLEHACLSIRLKISGVVCVWYDVSSRQVKMVEEGFALHSIRYAREVAGTISWALSVCCIKVSYSSFACNDMSYQVAGIWKSWRCGDEYWSFGLKLIPAIYQPRLLNNWRVLRGRMIGICLVSNGFGWLVMTEMRRKVSQVVYLPPVLWVISVICSFACPQQLTYPLCHYTYLQHERYALTRMYQRLLNLPGSYKCEISSWSQPIVGLSMGDRVRPGCWWIPSRTIWNCLFVVWRKPHKAFQKKLHLGFILCFPHVCQLWEFIRRRRCFLLPNQHP